MVARLLWISADCGRRATAARYSPHGILVAAELAEGECQAVVMRRRAGGERDRPLDQRGARSGIAALDGA